MAGAFRHGPSHRARLLRAARRLCAVLLCAFWAAGASAQHGSPEAARDRAELLEAGVAEARRRVAYATDKLAEAREDVAETKQQLDALARELGEAKRRAKETYDAMKAAEEAAEKARRAYSRAQNFRQQAEHTKHDAEARLRQARHKKDESQRREAEKALKAAKEALDKAKDAEDAAKHAKRDTEKEADRAQRKHRDAKRQVGKLEGKRRHAESDLRRRQKRLADATDGPEKARLLLAVARRAAEPTPDTDVRDWRVQWRRVPLPGDARGVFAHPVNPDVVAVTTAMGLMRSTDGGATWTRLEATHPDTIGAINDVAFVPDDADRFYLASETRGVWATRDGGKTSRRIGSAADGLADDCVKGLMLYPADRSFRTLYAVHGERAGGISRSYDAGAHWHVGDEGYHVRRVLFQLFPEGKLCAMYLLAGTAEAPDVVNLYAQVVERLGGPEWFELGRSDVIRADAQTCPWRDAPLFLATLDKGLLYIQGDWGGASVRTLLEGDVRSWASGGTTWGPGADELLFAYEPRRLGVIVSEDRFETSIDLTGDLYVDAFVRDGASLRASADGGRFYAVVNGRLWIGQARGRRFGLHDVTLRPRVVRLAGRRKEAKPTTVTLTARAGSKCETVFADLRSLGGPSRAPLADDGKHADGEAGDGVYGLRWEIPATLLEHGLPYWAFHRRHELIRSHIGKQGLIGVGVYAADAHGRTEGATGVLLARRPVGDFVADEREKSWRAKPGKPWEEGLGLPSGDIGFDLSGYRAVSFRIRCDRRHTEDLTVELISWNRSGYKGVASVALKAFKLDADYAEVVLPLERFYETDSGFIPISARGLHVKGKTDQTTRYWITDLKVHAAGEDAEASRAASGGPAADD